MENNSEGLDNYLDNHFINRSNWLRAAVLGANDGILSTSSLAIGVAAASDFKNYILGNNRNGIDSFCWIYV